MSTRASAARYARALFDVVISEKIDLEQVERELNEFATLLAQNPDLQKALANPGVPVSGKRGIVTSLLERLKPASPLGKLLLMLADRDRLVLVPDLGAVFAERLMEHRQIIRAEVTTAVPLAPERAATLQKKLADVTGRQVTMTTKVDPSLIAGAVARVGGTVYDGSIASQLAKMKERLER
jgi:F-type H+-transporting ATPase subunit delta